MLYNGCMSCQPPMKWGESAYYWEKHRESIRSLFAPITGAIVEEAGIWPGQSILDVGGGTGEPSLSIAEEFGPSTFVLCSDPAREMILAAKRESQRRGLTNIAFCRCTGERLAFADNHFDRAVCRLGAMFFVEPLDGLREMLRVVRAGGRITLAVWGVRENNPMFRIVTDCLARYVTMPEEDEQTPGAFRLARQGMLADLLRQLRPPVQVRERNLDFFAEAPLTPDEFWTMRSEISETLRDKLALLSPEQLRKLTDEVKEAARPFFTKNRMRFPAQVLIVAATKMKDEG